jgi:hypothetical protein
MGVPYQTGGKERSDNNESWQLRRNFSSKEVYEFEKQEEHHPGIQSCVLSKLWRASVIDKGIVVFDAIIYQNYLLEIHYKV